MTRIFKLAMASLVALGPAPVAAATVEQELDVSVVQRYQHTRHGAPNPMPEKYGELPNGLRLDRYTLDYDNGGYGLDAEVKSLGKNNQSVAVEGGRPGKLTWKGGWDQIPHLFSNEARTLYQDMGNGNMVLVGAQNLRNLSTANFNNYVASTVANGRYVPLGFTTERGRIDVRFRPAQDFIVSVGGGRRTRNGTKPTSASFGFSNAIELAAPIDHVTNEASLRMELAKKDYQLAFAYDMSDFNNELPALYWDNPKRNSDTMTDNSGYSNGDRAARGIQAMEPSNKAHSLKLEGGFALPMDSRFSFEAGYKRWTALNPMLPYTSNSSITATNVALTKSLAASGFGPVPFDASDPRNLPDVNVDTKYDVFTYMGKLSSRPLSWLRGSLSHDAYIAENKSKVYTLPGFAVFDGKWQPGPFQTGRDSFREDKTALKLDYDITSWLGGDLGLSHKYAKQAREISKLREEEGTLGFTVRPSRTLFMNASYLVALRRSNGFDYQTWGTGVSTGGAQAGQHFTDPTGGRRVDLADRNRNQGRLQVRWSPGEASYGLSVRATEDKYRIGAGDSTGGDPTVYPWLEGVEKELQEAVGTDASIPLPFGMTLDTYYEFDFTKRIINSAQTASADVLYCGGGPGCGSTALDIMDPDHRWTTRATENSHAVGVGLSADPAPKLRTFIGYDMVYTRGNADPLSQGDCLANPKLPKCGPSAAVLAAPLQPYLPLPTTRRMQQTLKARAAYQLTKDLLLAANYQYDKFDINDYGYQEVPLRNPANDAIWLGASLRNYYAHTVSLAANYRF